MTDEQIREIAEKEASKPDFLIDGEYISAPLVKHITANLTEALRILDQAGFVCAPKEPTEDATAAGVSAYELTGIAGGIVNTAEQHVAFIYRAMLTALSQDKTK